MDFVTKLLVLYDSWTKLDYNLILVITDRLTKYIYMLLYQESSTAEDLARVIL